MEGRVIEMPKREFVRVTIDTTTYKRLTALAVASSLTRAEYIRRLIWSQDYNNPTIPEPVENSIGISAKLAALSAQGMKKICPATEIELDADYCAGNCLKCSWNTIKTELLKFVEEALWATRS